MKKRKAGSEGKTPIERIFHEIAKREMTASERRVLIPKTKKRQKSK